MTKDWTIYVRHIFDYIESIERITRGVEKDDFFDNEEKTLACLRCCQVIGEAVKKIPDDIKDQYPDIEWKKIAGFRDVIVHDYDGFSNQVFWDVVCRKIYDLEKQLKTLPLDTKEQK